MARCAYCGAETFIYEGGDIPICTECSDARCAQPRTEQSIRALLSQDLEEAIARNNEARKEFEAVMGHFPSGLPHPDGVQRIKNASRAYTCTKMEMLRAHHRLNDFLNAGIIPDDLMPCAECEALETSYRKASEHYASIAATLQETLDISPSELRKLKLQADVAKGVLLITKEAIRAHRQGHKLTPHAKAE